MKTFMNSISFIDFRGVNWLEDLVLAPKESIVLFVRENSEFLERVRS